MFETLIVLVNYNSPKDTYRCLESIALSSAKAQVVVVDNASTGDGLINEELAQSCYAATKVIFNPNNDGFGGGNNLGLEWGIANTAAKYFFVLNNDTVVLPNTIADLINYLLAHPQVGMCSPAIFRLNEPEIYWFGGGYIDWGRGGAISPNINRKLGSEVTVEHNTFISGCAMFMTREMLVKVGGFSPDYFMYAEDIDYCQRVLNAGYQIDYVSRASILHDAHASVVRNRSRFITPQHWSNKNLTFALVHMAYGAFLNLRKYSHGKERVLGTLRLCMRYSRWCASYVIHGRVDGIAAIYKGIRYSMIGKRPQ